MAWLYTWGPADAEVRWTYGAEVVGVHVPEVVEDGEGVAVLVDASLAPRGGLAVARQRVENLRCGRQGQGGVSLRANGNGRHAARENEARRPAAEGPTPLTFGKVNDGPAPLAVGLQHIGQRQRLSRAVAHGAPLMGGGLVRVGNERGCRPRRGAAA